MSEQFSTVVEVIDLQNALNHFDENGKVQVTIDDRGVLELAPPPGETFTIQRAS
jgi:hypothetical protein